MSASQIAEQFGLTRNAIIGKASRLKLGPKKQPVKRKPYERRFAVVMPPPLPELPPPAIMQLEFLSLTLDELRDGECHYPEGDGEQVRFCGQLVEAGSSYCPWHKRIVSYPVSAARRDRDMAIDVGRWRGVR